MLNLTFGTDGSQDRHVGDFTPLSWYKVDCDINPTQYVFSVTIDTGTYIHRFARNVGWTVKEIVFDYAVQTVYYDDFQYTAPVIPATLTIQSALGEPTPAVGTHNYYIGNVVTCEVASVTHALTNYSASGWALTGASSDSGSGPQAIFTLQGNTTLAWGWQTNYWLETSVSGSGSISPVEGFYPFGSTQGLAATPSAGWLFMGWGGDASGTEPTTVTLNGPRSVTATFSDDADNDGLTNTQEDVLGSDPRLSDTDADGFDDGFEVGQGLSPTNSNSAIVTYIANHSSTFQLYPSNTVLDVALGQALFNVSNNEASLRLQLEKSDDLVTWTNAADAVEWMIPVNSNQKFFRVRSSK